MSRPTEELFWDGARGLCQEEGKIEIDDDAPVRIGEDHAWVQAWGRVSDEEAKEEQEK